LIAKVANFIVNQTFLMLSSIIIATFSTSPLIGGQIFVIFTFTKRRLCKVDFNLSMIR